MGRSFVTSTHAKAHIQSLFDVLLAACYIQCLPAMSNLLLPTLINNKESPCRQTHSLADYTPLYKMTPWSQFAKKPAYCREKSPDNICHCTKWGPYFSHRLSLERFGETEN